MKYSFSCDGFRISAVERRGLLRSLLGLPERRFVREKWVGARWFEKIGRDYRETFDGKQLSLIRAYDEYEMSGKDKEQ